MTEHGSEHLMQHSIEREEILQQLAQIQADLVGLENAHHMDSATFYQRWQAGEMDDRMDFVEWASLCQMMVNLQEQLALLEVTS